MKTTVFFRLCALVLCGASLLPLAGCKEKPAAPVEPTEPTCIHTFTDWTLQETSDCKKEGREDRYCTKCRATEERPIAKKPHDLGVDKICRSCRYVDFDPNADIVELGNPVAPWYTAGAVANCPWDLAVWNGILYRAAGDYDKNPGATPIWGYDIANQRWKHAGEAADEALHRFVEIDGKLMSPGIDPRAGWDLGNYYVLDKTWKQVRNLPNGIHNFDMIEYNGYIFAGLGVEEKKFPCVISTDKGQTFQFVPLYKDGNQVDTKGMTYIRVYEYIVFKDQLYALVQLDSAWGFYRFETDKLVYVADARNYLTSNRASYNYLNAKLQLGDTCFLVSNCLYAVKDFADPSANTVVMMPGKEFVSDALLKDGVLYVLAYLQKTEDTYETVIYKSATGEEGSFEVVTKFDYAVPACSFALEGDYFYVGMGSKRLINKGNGMLLRVKHP